MSSLVWGDTDKRLYETGIDRGVFYPLDGVGVPWSGLITVSEAPSGTDITKNYVDGVGYYQARNPGSFAAKISAYTYPLEFEGYDGVGKYGLVRRRKLFNFTYRTKIGSGYLIHLVYNATATPAARNYTAVDTGVNPTIFEWDIDTVGSYLPSGETSAHFVINTLVAYPWAVKTLEDLIYGSVDNDPKMPSMISVINLFENASILKITDNGDGTWTAEGPEEAIRMVTPEIFEITWPSALYIDTKTYSISSL
jgi:hypothetical protein